MKAEARLASRKLGRLLAVARDDGAGGHDNFRLLKPRRNRCGFVLNEGVNVKEWIHQKDSADGSIGSIAVLRHAESG
jgi:ribosomal protein S18 acetylase RimI-like enzyme